MSTKVETRRSLLAPRAGDFTDELIEPFTQLRSEVDRLFHAFPFRMPSLGLGTWVNAPALEMTATDKAYKITAEIPGMEPDDVEVTFEDGLLRIAGEKKEEREEDERGYRLSERSYGAFERLVKLPQNADEDSLKAKFRNGVLTISIAKNHNHTKSVRRIKVDKA